MAVTDIGGVTVSDTQMVEAVRLLNIEDVVGSQKWDGFFKFFPSRVLLLDDDALEREVQERKGNANADTFS